MATLISKSWVDSLYYTLAVTLNDSAHKLNTGFTQTTEDDKLAEASDITTIINAINQLKSNYYLSRYATCFTQNYALTSPAKGGLISETTKNQLDNYINSMVKICANKSITNPGPTGQTNKGNSFVGATGDGNCVFSAAVGNFTHNTFRAARGNSGHSTFRAARGNSGHSSFRAARGNSGHSTFRAARGNSGHNSFRAARGNSGHSTFRAARNGNNFVPETGNTLGQAATGDTNWVYAGFTNKTAASGDTNVGTIVNGNNFCSTNNNFSGFSTESNFVRRGTGGVGNTNVGNYVCSRRGSGCTNRGVRGTDGNNFRAASNGNTFRVSYYGNNFKAAFYINDYRGGGDTNITRASGNANCGFTDRSGDTHCGFTDRSGNANCGFTDRSGDTHCGFTDRSGNANCGFTDRSGNNHCGFTAARGNSGHCSFRAQSGCTDKTNSFRACTTTIVNFGVDISTGTRTSYTNFGS